LLLVRVHSVTQLRQWADFLPLNVFHAPSDRYCDDRQARLRLRRRASRRCVVSIYSYKQRNDVVVLLTPMVGARYEGV